MEINRPSGPWPSLSHPQSPQSHAITRGAADRPGRSLGSRCLLHEKESSMGLYTSTTRSLPRCHRHPSPCSRQKRELTTSQHFPLVYVTPASEDSIHYSMEHLLSTAVKRRSAHHPCYASRTSFSP